MLSRMSLGSHLGIIALMTLAEQALKALLIWVCVQIFFNRSSEHQILHWLTLGAGVCLAERALAWCVGLRASAWIETIFANYVADYSQSKRLGSYAWLNDDARDQDVPFLATESLQGVEEFVSWFVDFIKNIASILVFFFVFIQFTNFSFLPFMVFSLVAGFILARWLWRRHKSSSQLLNEGRGRLSMLLLGSWDNVALGNEHNRKQWKHRFLKELHVLGDLRVLQFKEKFTENTFTLIFVSLPIFVYLFHEFQQTPSAELSISAIFLLTYSALNLSAFPSTFFGALSFPEVFVTLKKMHRVTIRPVCSVSEDRLNVDWNQLVFAKEGVRTRLNGFSEISKYTKSFAPARHTLMGPEHCGKTAFLLNVKNLHPDKTYFIPGQNTLSFAFELNEANESEGYGLEDRLLKCLSELKEVSQGGIILLDDWDVYLDPLSAQKISQAIEELSLFRCVFETRRTAF